MAHRMTEEQACILWALKNLPSLNPEGKNDIGKLAEGINFTKETAEKHISKFGEKY